MPAPCATYLAQTIGFCFSQYRCKIRHSLWRCGWASLAPWSLFCQLDRFFLVFAFGIVSFYNFVGHSRDFDWSHVVENRQGDPTFTFGLVCRVPSLASQVFIKISSWHDYKYASIYVCVGVYLCLSMPMIACRRFYLDA